MENRNSKNSTENKHPNQYTSSTENKHPNQYTSGTENKHLNQYTSQNAKNSNAKNCR